jgi:hypothetical protein
VNQYLGNDKFISGTVKSKGLTLNANREELRSFVAEMKRKGSQADIEGMERTATSQPDAPFPKVAQSYFDAHTLICPPAPLPPSAHRHGTRGRSGQFSGKG